jgi:serine/threonine protein phosphatase PrpC
LLTDTGFLKEASKQKYNDGTTALVVALGGSEWGASEWLVVANAGDSRCVLAIVRNASADGQYIVNALPLSKDHRPDDPQERQRVQRKGGVVVTKYGSGVARVMGVLAVSRALGDVTLKPYITSEPDIVTVRRNPDHWFLIMATDGLWDVFTNSEAIDFVLARMLLGVPDCGAQALANEAFMRGSVDNISVLVIDLRTEARDVGRDVSSELQIHKGHSAAEGAEREGRGSDVAMRGVACSGAGSAAAVAAVEV